MLTTGTKPLRARSSPNEPLNPKGKASCWCTCHSMDGHNMDTCCGNCWMFHGLTLRNIKNDGFELLLKKRKKGMIVEIDGATH